MPTLTRCPWTSTIVIVTSPPLIKIFSCDFLDKTNIIFLPQARCARTCS